jgi:hypothetical protein
MKYIIRLAGLLTVAFFIYLIPMSAVSIDRPGDNSIDLRFPFADIFDKILIPNDQISEQLEGVTLLSVIVLCIAMLVRIVAYFTIPKRKREGFIISTIASTFIEVLIVHSFQYWVYLMGDSNIGMLVPSITIVVACGWLIFQMVTVGEERGVLNIWSAANDFVSDWNRYENVIKDYKNNYKKAIT